MSGDAKVDLFELPRREWLLPGQVAQFLNLSTRHVRRMVEAGKLIGWKPGEKCMRISRQSVTAYVQEALREYQEANGIFFDNPDSGDEPDR